MTTLSNASTGSSLFWTATPYAVATLTVGAVGLTIALTQTATVAVVAGAILAAMGAAAFYGVLACAIAHRKSVEDFRENVGQFMATAAAAMVAELITMVAKAVILELIFGKKK